jgi:hypothetical protein
VREAGQHRLISVNHDLIHEIAAVLPGSVVSTVKAGSKAAKKRKHS